MLNARRQKSAQAERAGGAHGEAMRDPVSDEAGDSRHDTKSIGPGLLQAVLPRANMQQARKRVKANKGAAGVDGLDIEQTRQHLVTAWPQIRGQLLQGSYRPSPVRRVTIPYSGRPLLVSVGEGSFCQPVSVEAHPDIWQ